MSKKSIIARQRKRERLIQKYAQKRKALKEAGNYQALALLPRDSSPVRSRNRCKITGRPRGYLRKFGVSRIKFRELALAGKIPGVTKASW
ncbi:MAG: 30S ribosomal protein S14 [Bacteroidia bacterium]|nr:30S ribosomal protein S14 [Bacteroidia bacterium]MDW8159378.1 30S ribosomal protein S14 [Bacteroidia bacterium]